MYLSLCVGHPSDSSRGRGAQVSVDKALIRSGDFLAITKFDGSGTPLIADRRCGVGLTPADPLIMFGTGGHTGMGSRACVGRRRLSRQVVGHSAVLLWDGDELFVVEAMDVNPAQPSACVPADPNPF
jgi:hypothetical protein